MRLLLLRRYGPLGASSRVRLGAYVPWLEAAGMSVTTQDLLPDEYLRLLYARNARPGRIWRKVFGAYAARAAFLARSRERPDVIWLEKELWPFVPAAIEWRVLARAPYVIDIDDAVFHNYDLHRRAAVRMLLGHKIDMMFSGSALVTAGARYLEERARAAGAPCIRSLPTVVDLERYPQRPAPERRGLTVGWIGSPATQAYLHDVVPVLRDLLRSPGDRLVSVGSNFPQPLFDRHEQQPWHVESEVAQVSQFDIGIMPLRDAPFERGKAGYKLIQYMACGCPVVASRVGANCDIVEHGAQGYLAASLEEWRAALESLRADPDLRARLGDSARARVASHYCLQVCAPQLVRWLRAIGSGERLPEID